MIFSKFKSRKSSKQKDHTWLTKSKLADLQLLAEQLCDDTASELTLNSQQLGHLASQSLGSGTDYAESRVYQYGDDPRSINWRLSARSQETFVKTFQTESRPCVSVFLDQRQSMIFGTKKRLKITQALRVASLLAYASNLHHLNFKAWILDDISLHSFNNTDDFISSANHYTKQDQNKTHKSIGKTLQNILPQLSQNDLFYLISDLTGLQKKTYLSAISERCFTQTIHIQDQAELSLPNIGELSLHDNHETHLKIKTQDKNEQLLFLDMAQKIHKKRKSLASNRGMAYTLLTTDIDKVHPLIRFPLKNI